MTAGVLLFLAALVMLALAWPFYRRQRGLPREPVAPSPAPAAAAPQFVEDEADAALAEIRFDYETGKLTEEDYRALTEKYERAAALRRKAAPPNAREDLGDRAASASPLPAPSVAAVASRAHASEPGITARELDTEAEALVRQMRQTRRACPVCGPRPEPDARYCSSCGRFLLHCPQCGRDVTEFGARFCARCGAVLEREAAKA